MNPHAFGQFLARYPQVLKLWASETLRAFGAYFFNIAVMWYVFAQTGSGLAMGLVVVANFLPTVVFGPWFGVWADRYHRRRLMLWANLFSSACAGGLAIAVFGHLSTIWLIYVVRGCMGIASTLYEPPRAALLPEMVAQDDLVTAHALFHSSQQLARIAGSAVGGLAVAVVGAGLSMTWAVVTFALAALLVALINHHDYQTPHSSSSPGSVWGEAWEGWHWLRQHPTLLVMIGITMVSNIALGPTNVLAPMLIRSGFHASARSLGLFDAGIGLGMVVGGIVIGMIRVRRFGIAMAMALSIETLGLLVVAVSPTPLVADLGNCLLGVGLVAANAPSGAMMQILVPGGLLGRVSSFSSMLGGLAVPITFGGVGFLGDAIGAHQSFGLATLLMATTALTSFSIPGIRKFKLSDSGDAPPSVPLSDEV